jgi:hypothetical protein
VIRQIYLTDGQARRLEAVASAQRVSAKRFAMNMILLGVRSCERHERLSRNVATLRAEGKSWEFIAKHVHIPASRLRYAFR